jgi:hypothetical protein
LIVIGHVLSVDMSGSGNRYVHALVANRPLHVSGGLITATAALLLSVGLWRTGRAFADSERRRTAAAARAASVGAGGMAMGLAMVAMVMGALAGADPHLAVRAYDILNHSFLASLPFLLAYLFTIGVLGLALSLIVAGANRTRWLGILLLAGTMVDFVSPSGGAITAALHVPQALAFALLGTTVIRRGSLLRHSSAQETTPIPAAAQPQPAS